MYHVQPTKYPYSADEQIHTGLDKYSAYISKCRQMPSNYKASELREIMDSFEKVLFQHLDEEVESLKGMFISESI